MIEFGTKRSGNGKKSRIHKKFPRKRIAKIGEKAAGWCRNNWDDDKYSYFSGNLHKFLLSNIGRPVDKVFPEFLKRCGASALRYNLKEKFYNMFEKREDITYWGGFYLTNGIINYKKRTKPNYHLSESITSLNKRLMPENLNGICRKCEETHQKQFLGKFWGDYTSPRSIYIIERKMWEGIDWSYDTTINRLINKYERVHLWGIGAGINRYTWALQSRLYPKVTYEVSDGWDVKRDKSDLIFITKITK